MLDKFGQIKYRIIDRQLNFGNKIEKKLYIKMKNHFLYLQMNNPQNHK